MITHYEQEQLIEFFWSVFSIGLKRQFHPLALESYITQSKIVNAIEKDDFTILDRYSKKYLIDDLFRNSSFEKGCTDLYDECLWVSMMYVYLFLRYKKSFEYLFLYIPIEEMFDKFHLYHEMSNTQLFGYFERKVSKKTLLSSLLKKNHFSASSFSVASGISINTIEKYSKSDEALYKASYENIYIMSHLLHVKSNIFVRKLFISESITHIKTENEKVMEVLGLFFAAYYDRNIASEKFEYDETVNRFRSSKHSDLYLLVVTKTAQIPPKTPIDEKTILVLQMNDIDFDVAMYSYFKRIIINSNGSIYDFSKSTKKELSSDIINAGMVQLEKK